MKSITYSYKNTFFNIAVAEGAPVGVRFLGLSSTVHKSVFLKLSAEGTLAILLPCSSVRQALKEMQFYVIITFMLINSAVLFKTERTLHKQFYTLV
jgi:hypothetical protein